MFGISYGFWVGQFLKYLYNLICTGNGFHLVAAVDIFVGELLCIVFPHECLVWTWDLSV